MSQRFAGIFPFKKKPATTPHIMIPSKDARIRAPVRPLPRLRTVRWSRGTCEKDGGLRGETKGNVIGVRVNMLTGRRSYGESSNGGGRWTGRNQK